ncbi:MAG: 16S rRNA (cytosine(1402)-N(4))-methyltransferase RsmH [Planctomycetia bacterium]|nr:16S rRNA (cytosine(1402)-N(4))-methyltransferase RsmH [Planctomycetia bacterium]
MTEETTVHLPVMLNEVVEALQPQPGKTLVDGTLGGAGHTIAIARLVGSQGLVLGIDRDLEAIDRAEKRIKSLNESLSIRLAQANYCDFPEALDMLNIQQVDGILLDLGLSSDQLADPRRGFSFDSEGELDLRFDTTEGVPAYELLNRWSAEQIADIIYKYGEERYSRRIARAIVEFREERPLRFASELAAICRRSIPGPRGAMRIDPATRTFQAIRIAVNEELKSLETFFDVAAERLAPGGRLAIISFHSLEDRIVKTRLRDDERYRVITRKPIEATQEELERNPRSRSAKLRVAERILTD